MKKIILVLFLLLNLCGCSEERLLVSFFSLGAADSTLIEKRDSVYLVDTGESDDADEIIEALNKAGITKIDAIFISHFDKDHIGGASEIIKNFEVGIIYTPYLPEDKESEEIDAFYQATEEYDVEVVIVSEETSFSDNGLNFTLYPPLENSYESSSSNNASLCLYLTYGDTSFFFAGDAEKERINELLEYGITCDVLKMPHHGRYARNSADLLGTYDPSYVVINSSESELEEEKLMALFTDETVYLTREGSVTFISNGKSISVTR